MRLIDIDIFPLLPNKFDEDESEYERGYQDATDNLKALPLVDAVPVVRCKDCKHYTLGPFGMGCMVHFNYKTDIFTHKPDDYCSYGKRTEDKP